MFKSRKTVKHIANSKPTFIQTARGYVLNVEITDPKVIAYLRRELTK